MIEGVTVVDSLGCMRNKARASARARASGTIFLVFFIFLFFFALALVLALVLGPVSKLRLRKSPQAQEQEQVQKKFKKIKKLIFFSGLRYLSKLRGRVDEAVRSCHAVAWAERGGAWMRRHEFIISLRCYRRV